MDSLRNRLYQIEMAQARLADQYGGGAFAGGASKKPKKYKPKTSTKRKSTAKKSAPRKHTTKGKNPGKGLSKKKSSKKSAKKSAKKSTARKHTPMKHSAKKSAKKSEKGKGFSAGCMNGHCDCYTGGRMRKTTKPLNAYQQFVKDNYAATRKELLREHPHLEGRRLNGMVLSTIAREWFCHEHEGPRRRSSIPPPKPPKPAHLRPMVSMAELPFKEGQGLFMTNHQYGPRSAIALMRKGRGLGNF